MAAIDFPTATSNGQTFEADTGVVYTYVGTPPNGYWSGTFTTSGFAILDQYIAKNDANTIQTIQTQGLKFNNGSTDTILIDGLNSRIGIGTTTTSGASTYYDDLVINNTASGTGSGITLLANATNGSSAIDFGDTDAIGRGRISYSHAVDNLIIDVAGTEAARIDSSGNIGIGTTSIDASLHVKGAGTHGTFVLEAGGTSGISNQIYIQGHNNAGTSLGEINFEETAANQGALVFKTNGGSVAERMRIDSSGNVAIGSNTQGHGLLTLSQSASSAFNALVIQQGNTGSAATDGLHIGIDSAVDSYIIHKENRALYFGTANTERARIDSSGNLGVGTQSPFSDAKLTVDNGGSGDVAIALSRSGSGQNDAAIVNSGGELVFKNGFASTVSGMSERMRIDTAGNVGLGKSSNLFYRLTFQEGAGDANRIGWVSTSGNRKASIDCGNTAALVFNTGTSDTERMRIDSSGRLLVGTSSAYDVAGVSGYTPRFQLIGNTAETASILAANEDGSSYLALANLGGGSVVSNGEQLGRINFKGNDGNSYPDFASITAEVDGTPGDGDCPGRLVFSTTADGANSPTVALTINRNQELFSVPTYAAVTTNAANVFIASNGNMARSTSSRKYKTNIETLEDQYADRILDCRPVWFRSIATKDNPDHGYWGFIAEEVAEIDSRLVHWKTIETSNDENGSSVETPCDPEPEGVQYDRFVPHLLNLIKRQKEDSDRQKTAIETIQNSSENPIDIRQTTSLLNNPFITFLNSSGDTAGSIIQNGVKSVTYATSSDYRLKENVVELTAAIPRLKQLAPKRFNFTAAADVTVDGFLAHEAQAVVPEAVTGSHNQIDGDGNPVMQGIDQSKLVPLLTAALQEAIGRIETLEQRLQL